MGNKFLAKCEDCEELVIVTSDANILTVKVRCTECQKGRDEV